LPPGANDLTVVIGNDITPLRVNVCENRVTLVRLESEKLNKVGQRVYFKPLRAFAAKTTLPKPEDIKRVRAEPASYDALVDLLQEEDWGLRAYALRRLQMLGDPRAVPHLEKALAVEDNPDLKDVLTSLIDRLRHKLQ